MTIATGTQRAIWTLCVATLFQAGCADSNGGHQQAFRLTDERQGKIQQHIESFIRAHEKWEIETYDNWRDRSGDADLVDSIQQSYVQRLQGFYVDGAPIQTSGFGRPLHHESKYEKVSSIESRSDDFIVRTTMTRRNGAATITEHYEYLVVIEDGQPKISEHQWQLGE